MKWAISVCAALLLIAGAVWSYKHYRANAQLAKVDGLRKQLFSPEAKDMPSEQRKALWKEFRAEAKQLTEEQRDELFGDFRRREEERINQFFALPDDQRTAYLDQVINESEKRKKQVKKDREKRPATASASGVSRGSSRGPNASGQRGGGGGSRDSASRDQRRRDRLDRTTPEQRAKSAEFRAKLAERRKQRGL